MNRYDKLRCYEQEPFMTITGVLVVVAIIITGGGYIPAWFDALMNTGIASCEEPKVLFYSVIHIGLTAMWFAHWFGKVEQFIEDHGGEVSLGDKQDERVTFVDRRNEDYEIKPDRAYPMTTSNEVKKS